MKKKLLLLSFLSFFISFTSVNASTSDVVKDPILKQALLDLEYPDQPWLPKVDTNNDGKISAEEAGKYCGSCGDSARIDLVGFGFDSIEGMEYFDNIKEFYFSNNNVSDITPLLGMEKLEATCWDYNRVGFSSSYTLYNYAKEKDVIFQRTLDHEAAKVYKELKQGGAYLACSSYQQVEHEPSKILTTTPKHRVLFVIVQDIDADFENTAGDAVNVDYTMDDLDIAIINEHIKLYEKWIEVQSGYQMDVVVDTYITQEKITNDNNDLFIPGLTADGYLDYATFPEMIHEVEDIIPQYDTSFAVIYMSDAPMFTDQNNNTLTFSAGTAYHSPKINRGQVYISYSNMLNEFFVNGEIETEDDFRKIKQDFIAELKKGYHTSHTDTFVHEFAHTLEMYPPYLATWEYHTALDSSYNENDPLYGEYSDGLYANSLYFQGIPNPYDNNQVGIISSTYTDGPTKHYSEDIANPGKATLSTSLDKNNRIIISWNETENTDYYRIYRSLNENNSYEYLGKLTENTYTDTTAKKGKTYYYMIETVNVEGSSVEFTNSESISAEIPVPKYDITSDTLENGSITANVSTSIAGETITITCNPNNGFECVNIKVYNTSTNEELTLNNNKFTMPEYNVTISATIRRIINAPRSITFEARRTNYNVIELYTNNIECDTEDVCPDYIEIYYSLDNENFNYLTTINNYTLGDLLYTHLDLTPNKTYYYKLKPYNNSYGTNKYGETTSSFISTNIDPVNLDIEEKTYNSTTIKWSESEFASHYIIYRKEESGNYKAIKTLNSSITRYKDTSLTPGKTYYYAVKALKQVNTNKYYSDLSNDVKAIINLNSPNLDGHSDYYTYAKISYNKIDGAQGYRIYRSETIDGTYKALGNTTSLYYLDKTATVGKTYYYKVRAYTKVGKTTVYSDYSNEAKASVLANDVEFSLSNYNYTTNKITITKDENITKYHIYRATSKTGKYSKIVSLNASDFENNIEYLDKKLSFNKTYYYKVRVTYKNTSDYTSYKALKVKLVGSSTVTGTDNYYTYARINFTKVTGATGYRVYRSETIDGTYTVLGTTTKLYYADKTAEEGKTYYYKVRAYRNYGSKAIYATTYSNTVEASRLDDTIEFSLSNYNYSTNKITITKDENATKYYIYRATSKTGKYSLVTTLIAGDFDGDITYLDKKLSFNKTYYYKVKMVYKNTSDYSSYKSLKTKLIGNSTVTGTDNYYTYARINFTKVTGATGYRVYRSDAIDGTYKALGTTTKLYYADKTAEEGKTYYYKVRAYRNYGSKAIYATTYSNIVEASRLEDTIKFSLSSDKTKTINLLINRDENAVKYYIYRATSKTGKYSLVTTLNASDFDGDITYLDKKLTSNKTYYYKIKMIYKNASDYSSTKKLKAK